MHPCVTHMLPVCYLYGVKYLDAGVKEIVNWLTASPPISDKY